MENWYKHSQTSGFVKIAGFSQTEHGYYLGDHQRWVLDTYEVRLFLTKTKEKISISLNVFHYHLGMMMFQDFWKYGLDEEAKAKSSFSKMKAKADEIKDLFTSGDDFNSPNLNIANHLRTEFWEIDREHLAKSNIPHINYSRQKATYEKDWRSSIYGNRYPTGETSGF